MKKLLSLLLAAGMLAGACAPAAYAAAEPSVAVQQTATPESAEPEQAQQAKEPGAVSGQETTPGAGSDAEQPVAAPVQQTLAAAKQSTPENASQETTLSNNSTYITLQDLSYCVTTEDGIFFQSDDPFSQFTLVEGKEYTFYPLIDGEYVTDTDYTLQSVKLSAGITTSPYLEVVSTDSTTGSFVVRAKAATGGPAYMCTLQLNYTHPDYLVMPTFLTCISTTVPDDGRTLFVNQETGAPISSLAFTPDKNTCTLSLPAASLDESTQTIVYGTSTPNSLRIETDGLPFGTVRITAIQPLPSGSSLYATVKSTATGEALQMASISLQWNASIQADTLPGGSQIYFGAKEDGAYRHWYSAQYSQVTDAGQSGMTDASLQLFFGVVQPNGYTVEYSDLPVSDTIQSISVESLSDQITILSQTPQSGEDPFSFQYRIDLRQSTAAQLQANVTLADGTTYHALFTIAITEPVQTQQVTVSGTEELKLVLADPTLVAGSTIYLESGIYAGDFEVNTPVTLVAANYNGTQLPYYEDGSLRPDKEAVTIQGTITAKTQNVNVIGLRFEAQDSYTPALTDACLISGCTFSSYETAVVLSQTVQNSSNYRLTQNFFEWNGTAILFAGREWLSNVQRNSFWNNDCAVRLASGCYIDGPTSKVYGSTINGGKWTDNLFQGDQNQKVLVDERTDNADTLLLNYNYFAYGSTTGAEDALFSTQSATACNHSVYYNTPAMDTVSTNVSLVELANSGGLDLVAQQEDTTTDRALNVSATLFGTLQASSDAQDLQLNVWTADEELAASWDFEKSRLNENWAADSVNLGVSSTLDAAETAVVEQALPADAVAQPIHFAHEGDLPGTATVQVPLTASVDTNQELGLFYIDEANNTLVLQDTNVSVTDTGMVQFEISHCSSYLVAPVKALAPFAKDDQQESHSSGDTTTVKTSGSTAPAAQSPDGTVYYVCPACGYHNWTATADGYRCDNCGYLEVTKQLSSYGNVKGVYTPGSAAAATSAGARTAIPATSDESHPMVWVVLLVLAALGFGGAVYAKRKHDQNT